MPCTFRGTTLSFNRSFPCARGGIPENVNFNGRYGCNICEIKTKQCRRIVVKKSIRIYVFSEEASKLRTGLRMELQAQRAITEGKAEKGIKGHSVLSSFPFLDLSTCVVPESMHAIALGVIKQLLKF